MPKNKEIDKTIEQLIEDYEGQNDALEKFLEKLNVEKDKQKNSN